MRCYIGASSPVLARAVAALRLRALGDETRLLLLELLLPGSNASAI